MNAEPHATLQSFRELESLGIQTPKSGPISEQFTSTIQTKGGRYEVSFPWWEYRDPLADNFALCRRSLAWPHSKAEMRANDSAQI